MSSAKAAQDNKGAAGPLVKTQTGLPLPRFVSLKSERVNVRRGPSNEHGVAWVFTRKSLPVEIIAEFDHWRRIRDSEGAEGWVY
ncbi:MAG: SH3 domain-containing protein, partial [Pseudomonadota bacterium]